MQAHRERLLALLQDSWCHEENCKRVLSQARALQLGADFSQVQALNATRTWNDGSSLHSWNPLAS